METGICKGYAFYRVNADGSKTLWRLYVTDENGKAYVATNDGMNEVPSHEVIDFGKYLAGSCNAESFYVTEFVHSTNGNTDHTLIDWIKKEGDKS